VGPPAGRCGLQPLGSSAWRDILMVHYALGQKAGDITQDVSF